MVFRVGCPIIHCDWVIMSEMDFGIFVSINRVVVYLTSTFGSPFSVFTCPIIGFTFVFCTQNRRTNRQCTDTKTDLSQCGKSFRFFVFFGFIFFDRACDLCGNCFVFCIQINKRSIGHLFLEIKSINKESCFIGNIINDFVCNFLHIGCISNIVFVKCESEILSEV